MKTFYFIRIAAMSLFLAFAAAVCADAQENGNRDKDGNIVRGPYETNRFGDNIWIGVAGGINVFENSFTDVGGVNPALDINVGKWLTPSFGIRVGYQGLTASSWSSQQYPYYKKTGDDGRFKNSFGHAYIHGDMLWNISNAFSGYKETRTWNFVPFFSAGLARSFSNGHANNEFALGVGLLNNIRISDLIDLTLEVRQLVVKEGYDYTPVGGVAGMTSATFGVSFKLGRTGFRRSESAAYRSRINDLECENANLLKAKDKAEATADALAADNAALREAVHELGAKDVPEEPAESVSAAGEGSCATVAVFFGLDKTTLTEQELFHLDSYVRNALAADPDKVFVLTGYADKATGTARRNNELKSERVRYVSELLMSRYGIPEDRLDVRTSESDRWDNAALNRCVVIE